MKGTNRTVVYFNEPGGENTDEVLEVVHQRLKEGGIKSVIVASSTGETGIKFARRMAGETNLVVVSSHVGYSSPGVWDFDPGASRELETLGCKVVRQSHILSGLERSFTNKFSGVSHTEVLAEAFRSLFGVGIKVAIECTVMAADSGAIPIEKTIAVGGTEGGADCAMVVWPAHCNTFFDFRVLEILAKPYQRMQHRE
jgi:uncharacterized protein